MNMKRLMKITAAAAAALILAVSCNLDSGQGVYQKVFNDTPKNYEKIESVLGVIGGKLILYANTDLYSFDGTEMVKEADLTGYSMEGGYVPFMAAADHVFFSYVDRSNPESGNVYRFFSATVDEIKAGLTDEFVRANDVSVTLENGSGESIVLFNGLYNFTLDETQVTYTLSSDNQDLASPDDKITHYGFIEKDSVSENSFTIRGGVEVHASASIIGHRAMRVYAEDSDIEFEDTRVPLSDTNLLYIIDENGRSTVEYSVGEVDYDNMVMGTDGDFFITLDGDLFRFTASSYELADADFATDLIYRNNNLMPVYVSSGGDRIGYLYEEGIYINPAGRTGNDLPVKVRISDDNDLITSAWIGQSGDRFLMATQENGFWVVRIINDNGNYEGSTIRQYDPRPVEEGGDGPLADYL